jgi:ABC-2 type transport system permease protein
VYTTWIVTAGASGPAIPVLAAVFFAVMGCMAVGHEYRYGTNKATLTANPDRLALLTAKAVVLSAWVAVSAVLGLLVNVLLAALFASGAEFDSALLRPGLMYLLYCVAFGLVGFALAAIYRNQVGAIVTVLVWPLVFEPIVFTIIRAVAFGGGNDIGLGKIVNLLPASAGRRTMFRPFELWSELDVENRAHVWGLGASTLTFWIGVLLVVAIGSTLFVKRDA